MPLKLADECARKLSVASLHPRQASSNFQTTANHSALIAVSVGPNKTLQRYQMSPQRKSVTAYGREGFPDKMLVLQSGEDPWYDTDRLIWIIRKINPTKPRNAWYS